MIVHKKLGLLIALLFSISIGYAQKIPISGKVTAQDGKPIPNASVVTESQKGGSTDVEGNYRIEVPRTDKKVTFSAVGYETQSKNIGSGGVIDVTLKPAAATNLDDIVVTGYVTRKRNESPGATNKISGAKINQVPIASFDQMLQGTAPGLQIGSGSGQPGAAAAVRIRGVASISGSTQPLYVLDGVPIEASVFNTLNANDFESVDVLKDASSAGLYGSRGGNGVIVITTKKGRENAKPQFRINLMAGFSEPPTQYNLALMNTAQRLQYEQNILGGRAGILGYGTATSLSGYPGWDYNPLNPRYGAQTAATQTLYNRLLDSIQSVNTDWESLLMNRGSFKQIEASVSGGGNKLTYYQSLSAYLQNGIIYRSNLDRYTYRSNLDLKTSRITLSVRATAGYSVQNNTESEAAIALANPIAAAYLELPYRRLYRDDGAVDVGPGKTGPNAYDRLRTSTFKMGQFKGVLSVSLQMELFGGLAFKTTDGVDYRANNNSRYIKPNSFAGSNVVPGNQGLYNESNDENVQYTSTTGLVFAKTFKDKHKLNVQAMYEAFRNKYRGFGVTGYGLNTKLINTPAAVTRDNATLIPTYAFNGLYNGRVGKTISGISSLFTILDYNFDKRYTITGHIRRDASSRAAPKFRSVNTYGVGFVWNAVNEKFMQQQQIFDVLSFRISYGEVANINSFPSDFGYVSTYGNTNYAGTAAIVPTAPGNEDYKIETQTVFNVGLDVNFWDNRLRFVVDAYRKDANNLLVTQSISRTTGFNSLFVNAGSMRNEGIDAQIGVDLIRKDKQRTYLTLNINGGLLKNRITSLGNVTEIPDGTGILRAGLPFGSHYSVEYLGVDPQSGLPVYADINGNPTSTYSAANNVAKFGTYIPKFTGGAELIFTWKNLTVSTFVNTTQKVSRFNNESFFYESTNSNVGFNKNLKMLTETWTKPGDQTTIYQRISSPRQFSSRDIMDASYVRLRNVKAGFTIPVKNDKIMKSFRVYAQGENIYTWTKWRGFDPEESNNIATYEFPNPTTYTIGLEINF